MLRREGVNSMAVTTSKQLNEIKARIIGTLIAAERAVNPSFNLVKLFASSDCHTINALPS